ncbi:MAG: hypothetical protein GEU82_04665 [Luteitalea sp.]|nr:hypothetical protein [Luteitalea sp.]
MTKARFFVPGGGELPATTTGFGAIFSDVDQLDGHDDKLRRRRTGQGPRRQLDLDAVPWPAWKPAVHRRRPASKGDASLSFLGVLFDDARIAYVRIKTGTVAPQAQRHLEA